MKTTSCFLIACLLMMAGISGFAQKGKDGAKSYTTAGTYILNRYTTLAASVSTGALSLTVSNINNLKGSTSFTNSVNPYPTDALGVGDLVLIVQVQGADINTSNTINYGTITAYNNTGNYEIKYVQGVAGNVINFCTGLANDYSQGGITRTEVVRVPRLASLTVGGGVTLSGTTWSAASGTGGVVALEVNGNITLNGSISANDIGLNGGVDPDPSTSSTAGAGVVTIFRSTATTNVAGKGESIAGSTADYAGLLGAYGRGAPANGGGGGNGHNTGGGGGANAGPNAVLTPWNGTGLKNTSTASWANAWNLEAAGFATDVSVGGGRGGYSYSTSNQDALTVAPGNSAWGGDYRDNVGGLGGRPLNYNSDTRLFMGGGGGGGEGNNGPGVPGNGGNGGGIAYILCNGNISGSGTLSANGQDGFNTTGANPLDGSGGGGGGGAINAIVKGSITSISMFANGGDGGNQPLVTIEAEGPGAGGGGGYIGATATAVTRQVNGGTNGITSSSHLTEFTPDGATMGNAGARATKIFADVENCSLLLPVHFISFTAALDSGSVPLGWQVANQQSNHFFTIERSTDGISFVAVGVVDANILSVGLSGYQFTDSHLPQGITSFFYRIRQTDFDGKYTYSNVIRIETNAKSMAVLAISPNPARESVQVTYTSPEKSSIVACIINMKGEVVRKLTVSVSKGANNFIVNDLGKLPPSQYILRLQNSRETLNKTFIVLP